MECEKETCNNEVVKLNKLEELERLTETPKRVVSRLAGRRRSFDMTPRRLFSQADKPTDKKKGDGIQTSPIDGTSLPKIRVVKLRTLQGSPIEECDLNFTSNWDRNSPGLTWRSWFDGEAHAAIKSALDRSVADSNLTGDFSKRCILPLTEGHHSDIKSISNATLAGLIRGDFSDWIRSFLIVDCRYPYEYEGGHILGAVNMHTQEEIEWLVTNSLMRKPHIHPETTRRNIVVFHCEYSRERGPNLLRYLRSIDRRYNIDHYPALHYPEIYLLHGGYREFFKNEKMLCFPMNYVPMYRSKIPG